jgi:hypothetical protein
MFESFLMIVFKHAAMRNMVERFRFCRDMLEKYRYPDNPEDSQDRAAEVGTR